MPIVPPSGPPSNSSYVSDYSQVDSIFFFDYNCHIHIYVYGAHIHMYILLNLIHFLVGGLSMVSKLTTPSLDVPERG